MTLIDPSPHEHSPVRLDLLQVASAALDAINPQQAIGRFVVRENDLLRVGGNQVDLGDYRRAVIIGFGKASVEMGRAMVNLLHGVRVEGVLVAPVPYPVDSLDVLPGSHPVPDERSRIGGRRVLQVAGRAGPRDLAVVLISGGGSSLLAAPAEGVTLDDLKTTNTLLLYSGATIGELNMVRKHLSAVKGGRLAEALSKAGRLITLVLSDVTGSPLDVIASGPTVPDPTTFADALGVIDRYGLREEAPPHVVQHLEDGAAGVYPDTPTGGPIFERQILVVVADAAVAAQAAFESASASGPARVVTTELEGEARDVARQLVAAADDLEPGGTLVYAGETTVTVKGDGRGGRNQELALAASIALEGRDDVVILSMGTDGVDGMTTSAGAFADGSAVERGRQLSLEAADHLEDNDSGPFLTAIGDTIDTGPTGTNVGDLILVRRVDG